MTQRNNTRFSPPHPRLEKEFKNPEKEPSDETISVKIDQSADYILDDQAPFSRSSKELFADACEHLMVPAEATHFKRFKLLDQMTGGLRPYEFTLLSGQTGSGKTQLMANLSLDLIQSETPHFVASVETGPVDFMVRVMSATVGRDWNSGNAVPVQDIAAFRTLYREIDESFLHLSLYDNRVSVERLMHDLAWHYQHHGTKIAILDNLNFFLEVTDAQNQNREMDRVIHELVIFCKRVPMHLILVVHPRKNDSGRVTSPDDIRGSVLASQESHNIFVWNRAHPDNVKSGVCSPSDRELTILKMRRRGRFVGQTLIFSHEETVRFHEAGFLKS